MVDLETSGVSPFAHEALTVALVPIDEGLEPITVYVRPRSISWTDYAWQNFQKFRAEWELAAVDPPAACTAIEEYVEMALGGARATLIGHNIAFDLAFLRKLAFEAGREELSCVSHRAIDTHSLLFVLSSMGRVPETALDSDGAFDYFGIALRLKDRHTALGDALATRELFLRLLQEFGGIPNSIEG